MAKIDMRLCYELCKIYGKGAIMDRDLEASDRCWSAYEAYYAGDDRRDCDPSLEYKRVERSGWRFPDGSR
jgi:hypothetical protein